MMNIWLLVDRGAYTVNNWISQWCRCLVDDSWTILPALVQQALYDIGYRNPGLESLDIARRRRCFPPPPAPALTMRRVDIGHFLSHVYGWPSTGGVWTKTVDTVELVFLGIDPQHAKRCGNQMEEDDFCQRLKRLGARFYANEGAIRLSRIPDLSYDRVDIETDIDHELDYQVGWPVDGGVWISVLDLTHTHSEAKQAKIHSATSMEERCRTIQDLGGRYYSDATVWKHSLER